MNTNEVLQARIAALETVLVDYMQRYGATELARRVMIGPPTRLPSQQGIEGDMVRAAMALEECGHGRVDD